MENINQAQAALQSVLTQLEVAGSEVEEERYRGQAAELEQRCQEMMLVLKVRVVRGSCVVKVTGSNFSQPGVK